MMPVMAKEDLLAPIPGDNPSGVSLRYEPVYDQIREARRGIDAAETPEERPAYYREIVELATEALATKSKDLQLAAWLTDALTGQNGFAGLAEGLALLAGLVDQFWDTVHPEIEDGDAFARIGVLEWVGTYYEARSTSPLRSARLIPLTASGFNWDEYQQTVGKDSTEFEAAFDATPKAFYKARSAELTACLTNLAELNRICEEKFGREGPAFTKLRTFLEEVGNTVARNFLKRKLEKEPDPVEAPAATTEAVTADATGAAAPPTLSAVAVPVMFEGEVSGLQPQSVPEAFARIVAAAHYLRRQSPASPVPYLALRAMRWGELRSKGAELPAAMLTAPPTDIRVNLRSLAAAGRWADVLDLAEQAMASECGRGWLDVQRYSITACEHLGYEAVAEAIRSELKALLNDYPALNTATLLDDTGAANPETVAWLADGMKKRE